MHSVFISVPTQFQQQEANLQCTWFSFEVYKNRKIFGEAFRNIILDSSSSDVIENKAIENHAIKHPAIETNAIHSFQLFYNSILRTATIHKATSPTTHEAEGLMHPTVLNSVVKWLQLDNEPDDLYYFYSIDHVASKTPSHLNPENKKGIHQAISILSYDWLSTGVVQEVQIMQKRDIARLKRTFPRIPDKLSFYRMTSELNPDQCFLVGRKRMAFAVIKLFVEQRENGSNAYGTNEMEPSSLRNYLVCDSHQYVCKNMSFDELYNYIFIDYREVKKDTVVLFLFPQPKERSHVFYPSVTCLYTIDQVQLSKELQSVFTTADLKT